MKKSWKALCACLLSLVVCSSAAAASASAVRPAPICSFSVGGQSVDLSRYRGKVVYLDFWASWCIPCMASFPFMQRLHQDLSGRGLVVLAVDMDASPADGRAFLARHPVGFDVATGSNADCARRFGVAAMPSTYIIDRSGTIRAVHTGFRGGEAQDLRRQVEQLLSERAS